MQKNLSNVQSSGTGEQNDKESFSRKLRLKLNFLYNMRNADYHFSSICESQIGFKDYLLSMHSIMRASVPLMQAAYMQCDTLSDGKVKDQLKEYFERHSLEEQNHDEWLLDDLESIGVPRQQSLSRKPSQAAVELVGSQYYWIYHWHPLSLLGYISYLEGNPPKKDYIETLQKMTGYPDTAFRTMLKHSDLDPRHRDDLDEVLDSLPLTDEHKQWITSNALYTASKLLDIRNRQ
jgi:hypothetical protein